MQRSLKTLVVPLATGLILVFMAVGLPVLDPKPKQVSAQRAPASGDAVRAAQANNAFGLDLYAQVREEPGNLFFSPYSIASAFAMVYGGARSNTKSQVAEVFHFEGEQEGLHQGFSELNGLFNSMGSTSGAAGKCWWSCDGTEEVTLGLCVANALWAQQGHIFLDAYLELLDTYYEAAVSLVDFALAPGGAASQINDWVRTATENEITELVTAQDLAATTRLVLTNAIYFKGAWVYQFDKKLTQNAPFYLADGSAVEAPMMEAEGDFRVFWHEDFDMVEMPYVGGELAMVVLLPHAEQDINGLKALDTIEAELSAANLEAWVSELAEQRMTVYLPKFSMETRYALKESLIAMGMPDAFDQGVADFSGMDGTNDLFVFDAFQAAFVDVNEEGTEAGAATAVTMSCSARPPFRADHPFIFLIRDTDSGAILFLGRMANPLG